MLILTYRLFNMKLFTCVHLSYKIRVKQNERIHSTGILFEYLFYLFIQKKNLFRYFFEFILKKHYQKSNFIRMCQYRKTIFYSK